jgi:hypothetical protein
MLAVSMTFSVNPFFLELEDKYDSIHIRCAITQIVCKKPRT